MLQELKKLSDYRDLMEAAALRQIRSAVMACTIEFEPGPVRPDELEQILAAGQGTPGNLKAHVIRVAGYVFQGNEEATIQWLMSPHMVLTDGRRKPSIPLDIAGTAEGARRVERVLWDIYYGLPV